MSAETERSMLDRLNVRYGKVVRNGKWIGRRYTRAEHVPLGLSFNRSRIADFIAADMHSASAPYDHAARPHYAWSIPAPVMHGHEVKVSRSDWLTELRTPEKAEAFRQHMHYWWLVAADMSIVRDDLPDGWGLMVPHGNSLRVVVQATPNTAPEPMPVGLTGALLRATAQTEARLASDSKAAAS